MISFFSQSSIRVTVIVAFLSIGLGGCMSEGDEKNAPLPVMGEDEAKQRTLKMAENMASAAKAKIDKSSKHQKVQECTGKNDETAEDGRYMIDYAVRAPLSVSEHSGAARQVRDFLKEHSYEILSFQDVKGREPSVVVEAVSPDGNFNVAVDGHYSHDSLLLSVSTSCLLPPGVEQEQF